MIAPTNDMENMMVIVMMITVRCRVVWLAGGLIVVVGCGVCERLVEKVSG